MTLLSATLLLFLVMDPLGNVPFFLTLLKDVEPKRQRLVLSRELLLAYFILLFFLFAGGYVLAVLHISEPSLTIAGGIILFLIAIKMIFPTGQKSTDLEMEGEPFLVPLAVPLIAGPSTLASIVLIVNREPERWPEWLLAVTLAWLGTGLILLMASGLRRWLGLRGLIAMERLMGMVLTTVAVQMFMDGIERFIKGS